MKNRTVKSHMGSMKNQKGLALLVVLSFMAVLVLSTVYLTQMLQRDAKIIYRAKVHHQARLMAEAGLHHAFADIMENGYDTKSNFTGTLDTGSYSVSYSSPSGRDLVTSVGTVGNVTATVSAEITGSSAPSALYYFSSAGNDIWIFPHPNAAQDSYILGDIHANNFLEMRAHKNCELRVTGRVSSTGVVQQGNNYDKSDVFDKGLYINGLNSEQSPVYEDEPRIVFPVFDYSKYQDAAEDAGTFYSGDINFSGNMTSSGSDIIYVDGHVTISADTTISGGLIAKSITIRNGARLTQLKKGTRNVIIANETDLILNSAYLDVEEAVVMAERDIYTHEHWGAVSITGSMMAKRNLSFHNTKTSLYYEHLLLDPPDIIEGGIGDSFRVLSFND